MWEIYTAYENVFNVLIVVLGLVLGLAAYFIKWRLLKPPCEKCGATHQHKRKKIRSNFIGSRVTYEYECKSCGHIHHEEVVENFNSSPFDR